MEKKEAMLVHVSKGLEEMEGGRRATGISSSGRLGGLAIASRMWCHGISMRLGMAG